MSFEGEMTTLFEGVYVWNDVINWNGMTGTVEMDFSHGYGSGSSISVNSNVSGSGCTISYDSEPVYDSEWYSPEEMQTITIANEVLVPASFEQWFMQNISSYTPIVNSDGLIRLTGTYKWNDTPSFDTSIDWMTLKFSIITGETYNMIRILPGTSYGDQIEYRTEGDGKTISVYVSREGGWQAFSDATLDQSKIIIISDTTDRVRKEFYDWFLANTTPYTIPDDGGDDPDNPDNPDPDNPDNPDPDNPDNPDNPNPDESEKIVYIIEEETLKAIADAIRAKTGKTDPILVTDFATEILNICTSTVAIEENESGGQTYNITINK